MAQPAELHNFDEDDPHRECDDPQQRGGPLAALDRIERLLALSRRVRAETKAIYDRLDDETGTASLRLVAGACGVALVGAITHGIVITASMAVVMGMLSRRPR